MHIFCMPQAMGVTPSSRPGAGFVDPKLWYERKINPTFFDLNSIVLRSGYGY